MIGKPTIKWHDRAIQVAKYHLDRVKAARQAGTNWTIRDTAEDLERSNGRVSEDLMLAEYLGLPEHHNHLMHCRSAAEALDYIKRFKRDQNLKRFEHL